MVGSSWACVAMRVGAVVWLVGVGEGRAVAVGESFVV